MNTLLSQVKKKKADTPKATKKSGVPVVNAPDELTAEAVDKVRQAITAKKKAEADLLQYGDIVVDFFLETKETEARKMNFRKSFKINGDTEQVLVKHANKALIINYNDLDTIQQLLSKEEFETLLEETAQVFVRPEVLLPDSPLAEKLMGFLGETEEEQAENFALFFDSKAGLKIKPDFDRNVFRLAEKAYNALKVYVKMIRPGIQ